MLDPWPAAFVWKLKLPPQLKTFLCFTLHGKLLTNVYRRHRCMTENDACPMCHGEPESIEHALRDCLTARQICNQNRFPHLFNFTFHLPFNDWLTIHLQQTSLV